MVEYVEYQQMASSGSVPGKGITRAIVEKLSRRGIENGGINVSTEKWQNPGEYQEKVESVRVSKNCSCEFGKRVQSMCAPKNGRIRMSTKKSRIRASIEKLFE